jgi:hypothetical protein
MNAKRRNWDMRTVLYVLIIVLIVLLVLYFVLNPPVGDQQYSTPEEIRLKVDFYNGKTVYVEGLYYDSDGDPSLINPTNDANPNPQEIERLILNEESIESLNVTLIPGTKYRAVGLLQKTQSEILVVYDVELVLDSINEV